MQTELSKMSPRQLREVIKLPESLEFMNANGGIDPASQGYQYVIQTTTDIAQEALEQEFYEIPFGKYIPMDVGTGAFMEFIVKNLTYQSAGPFEQGIVSLSAQATVKQVSAGLAPITTKIYSWNAGYQYSLWEVRKALQADNWDVIRAKYDALVENYQLGIQQVAYLGLLLDPTGAAGLLSNPQVTINLSIIPQYIYSMSPTQLSTLVGQIMGAYFTNSNSTKLPTHFAIPMQDWLGLDVPWSPQFPNVSIREYLTKAFKMATKNPEFEIYGVAYADQVNNAGVWATNGTNRYTLYRNEPKSLKMYEPLELLLNAPATADNFHFQGVSMAQFTGVQIYRVPEVLYFDWHS
jgi:hypothetical protein